MARTVSTAGMVNLNSQDVAETCKYCIFIFLSLKTSIVFVWLKLEVQMVEISGGGKKKADCSSTVFYERE